MRSLCTNHNCYESSSFNKYLISSSKLNENSTYGQELPLNMELMAISVSADIERKDGYR
jgi:hypothetical protein